MGWKLLLLDPTIDGIPRYPKVRGNLVDGHPALFRHRHTMPIGDGHKW